MRLIPAQFVKPFVKSNKNDFVDAEAIAEAVERKNMRFVPIKTDDQLDLQAIHRVRDRLISRRTAVINQLRAFLLERGMVFAQTPAKLKAAMADILENAEADLTPQMRNLIDMLWGEWKTVEQQIEELHHAVGADLRCRRGVHSHPSDPRHRTDRGNSHRRCDRQRSCLPQGPRLRSMARCRATPVFHWRQGEAARHQQARQRLSAQGFDPRRTSRRDCASSEIERPSDPGWIDSMPELLRTSSWLPWRTSWHASHGLYCRADKTTDHNRTFQQLETGSARVYAPLQRI